MCSLTEYDKPFKTYDELIDLMKSRNIVINDSDKTKELLSDFSYYAIVNGLKDMFPSDGNKFIEPISFDMLYYLCMIDLRLNGILFKYILDVERSLKSKLSYIISKKYGVYTDIYDVSNNNQSDYFYRNNYKSSMKRNNILRKIKQELQIKVKEPDLKHYLENHNHVPCWITVNNISFGLTIKLYSISKSENKDYICNTMINSDLTIDEKKLLMDKSLQLLRQYRNKIAHGRRVFISSISTELPKSIVLKVSNHSITNNDYIKGIGKNDLFAVILILATLLRGDIKLQFISEIKYFFDPYKNAPINNKTFFEFLGLPNNFINILDMIA